MIQRAMINPRYLLSSSNSHITSITPLKSQHDCFPNLSFAKIAPSCHLKPWRTVSALILKLRTWEHNCRAVVDDESLDRADGNGSVVAGSDDEDEELCPVDCVREFYTDEEFLKILDKAKGTGALVVVDFFRNSCGSCKYIEQGFAKLCKGSGDEETKVLFLKHNVIDEYDEQSEVAERLRIKVVPLFHFYKDGVLVEAFPTRDKERITSAITKYTSSK